MKEIIRYGLVLALICILAAGLLAAVNTFTRPKIAAQIQAEEQEALKEVMPTASRFTKVKAEANKKEVSYYKAFDNQGKLIGFVFKSSSKGYSSVIETLTGVFLDERISAIKVISQNETPGLGVRVTEDKFREQFKNQNSLDLSGVQAIAGATISSRAVIDSIMKKAGEIRELIKNEK
jgi:electron transport complex protein RnfG